VNITVAGMTHVLCVQHASGGKSELLTISAKQPPAVPHSAPSTHTHTHTHSYICSKDGKVQNYCKPTAYTYAALYLFSLHHIAPTDLGLFIYLFIYIYIYSHSVNPIKVYIKPTVIELVQVFKISKYYINSYK
jgi:hypothetical protein